MDDPAFPDSHSTTTTTTTPTTVQSPPLTLDRGYIFFILAILRIVEIVVGLLYCILLLAACSGYLFPLFVSICCWILTVVFFILFTHSLDKRVTINWLLTEMINNLIWTIMHFVCACLVAADAARLSYYTYTNNGCDVAFPAVLGFALMVLYGLSTFFNFCVLQAGGGIQRLTGGTGGSATTTSVTTTLGQWTKAWTSPCRTATYNYKLVI